jgi:hypothetical protein
VAQPVWALSVDLQTKTATFTSGLADAARGARGSFNDIKQDAQTMGRDVNVSMTEARHGVMLLGEEFGVHLPRALTSFIASIGPVGAAMEAAFPFLAIIVGATLLIEHLAKLKEAGHELTEAQVNFGTVAANTLNGINDKLLAAGIRADELNHDHIGALNKAIERIDHQSMNELVSSFNEVSKAADGVLTKLDTHWYSFDAGSKRAKESLEEFRGKYLQLLAAHNEVGAADFLAESLKSQQKILDLQKQANANQFHTGQKGQQHTDVGKFEEAKNALKEVGYTWDTKEVQAQEQIVQALRDQVDNAKALAAAKALDVKNIKIEDSNREAEKQAKITADAAKGFDERLHIEGAAHRAHAALLAAEVKEEQEADNLKFAAFRGLSEMMKKDEEERAKLTEQAGKEEAQHESRMAELVLTGKKEHAQALVAQERASAQELLNFDRQEEMQAYQTQQQALQKEMAAVDKHDADYLNKEKALNNKLEELKKQHDNKIQQLDDQAATKQAAGLIAFANKEQQIFSDEFTKVVMGKQSFAQMMEHIDTQLAESALKFALTSLMQLETVQGRKRFGDARTAAADAFASAGNPITGAIEAVATFATVMSMHNGGVVPGVGTGDSVPAMLEPGEGVLNNKIMDKLSYASKFGGEKSKGPDIHIHHSPTYHVHALDGESVDRVLATHSDKFSDHVNRTIRKMNR